MKIHHKYFQNIIFYGVMLITAIKISSCVITRNQTKDRLPNIILINLDDVGYGDISCYGGDSVQTPRLNEMAAEGIIFTDFYATAAMCTPSRASLLTGCYPKRIGMSRFHNLVHHVLLAGDSEGLNPNEITIPQDLRERGYVTKMVGKWHLGDQPEFLPLNHGFDSFFGLPYSHDITPDNKANKSFHFPPLPLLRDNDVIESNPDRKLLTERFTNEAIEFISKNKDRHFFLYYAHILAHWPLIPTEEFLTKAENNPYQACLEEIDYSTGKILDALKEFSLDKNTLVILTSDNGTPPKPYGGSNKPLRGYKGQIWEGGFRLPCIMRWPQKIPKGQVCHELTSQMDILPTLAAITGSKLTASRMIDGKNISDLMFGKKDSVTSSEVFYYYFMNDLCAVRHGPWKLVLALPFNKEFQGPQLFNLDKDIGETTDISEKYPEKVKELETLIEKAREDIGDDRIPVEGKNCRPAGKVNNPVYLIQ